MPADNQIRYSPEKLAQCGILDAAQALRNIELLKTKLVDQSFSDLLPTLLSLVSVSADPDMALNNFERFVSGLADVPAFLVCTRSNPELLARLITISGASRFLAAFLVACGDASVSLLSDPEFLASRNGKGALMESLRVLAGVNADEKIFFRTLRLFRKKEMLRIALRDLLSKADLQETVGDLSDLAEVCLQVACEWADASLRTRYGRPMTPDRDNVATPARFAVVAMGKLGGRELNFSSDVDLMYVYSADGETEGIPGSGGAPVGKITNHQYFVKVSEKLTAAIGQKTEDGFVFRVDLRLRPEGQRGPLAQSLGGYEIYYESWGQTWERSALIKARPVAGDPVLGREFVERITPFVYRKYLDYGAIVEISDMKQKINKEVEQKGKMHRDVKLGYGGIREIEFVIQALQLMYAGRDRTLRERNSLRALHTLSQKGLITYQEHADLSKAYIFLRIVEHRIQLLDDLQTQVMPSDEAELRTLARRAGYLDQGREAELLLQEYGEHTGRVRNAYDDLFAFTAPDKETATGRYDGLLDPETTEHEASTELRKLGFREPGKAYRNLALLREGTAFVHQTPRSRKLFHEIFPSLFHEIATSPDPDMALNHLESFLAGQGSWEAFQSLVKVDPTSVRVLVAVFANSEYFSRMLVRRPALLENLMESRKAFGIGTSAVFSRELSAGLEGLPGVPEKMDALRRIKQQEEIRIGMADLLSNLHIAAVSRDLSKLAEACLEAALQMAVSETARRYSCTGSPAGLAVIGVGKLGGRELTYGSDLDILFVMSEDRTRTAPSGVSVFEYFSKVAEKTISYLSSLTREGYAFHIDTRLRPTGSKGPLVQSIEAFKKHYAENAATWERQALIRARHVAGDRTVGIEFCRTMQGLVYREYDGRGLAEDVHTMRKRIEEEVGKENTLHYNIKQGAGGLIDIEFLVQYLQLIYGKKFVSIRLPGTYDALRALFKSGLIESADYSVLLRAYLFMRLLESRMRIVTNQATSELIRDEAIVQPLARRMGYRDDNCSAGQKLLHEYELLSGNVRQIFNRILENT